MPPKNKMTFEDVNQRVQRTDDKVKNFIDEQSMRTVKNMGKSGKNDDYRYKGKAIVKNNADNFTDYLKGIDESKLDKDQKENVSKLKSIIEKVNRYADIDSTAIQYDDNEAKLYESILKDLHSLHNKLLDQMSSHISDETLYDDTVRMTANFLQYFEGQKLGNLAPVPENKLTVDTKGVSIKKSSYIDYNSSKASIPLFPHDPSLNDIMQGELGDCYLVSSLSTIAVNNADKIKDAMRDNQDGTVTVRFWKRNMSPDGTSSKNDTYEPVYVRVDKKAPAYGSAGKSCWVQIMERAYAASGLYQATGYVVQEAEKYGKPVPPKKELDALYKKLKSMPREDWPGHFECPWLIDGKGNLHAYEPSYNNIEGGSSGTFIEHLLGPDYQQVRVEISDMTQLAGFNNVFNSRNEVIIECMSKLPGFRTEKEKAYLRSEMAYTGTKGRNGDEIFEGIINYDAFYKILKNDPKAKIDMNNVGNDNDAIAAFYFAKDFELFITNVVYQENEVGTRAAVDTRGFKEYVKQRLMNPAVTEAGDTLKGNRMGLMADKELRNRYARLTSLVEKNSEKVYNQNRKSPKYACQYNGKELALFYRVEQAIKNKKPITLGTKSSPAGNGDAGSIAGLNYNHAYSVIGVEKKMYPAEEKCFSLK